MIKLDTLKKYVLILYTIIFILYPKIYLFNYIISGLIFCYLLLNINKITRVRKSIIYILVIALFYFLPAIYYNVFKSSIINLWDFIIRISPVFIGINEINNMKEDNKSYSNTSFKIIMICLLVYICFINMYYLNQDPYFARRMANYMYNVPGLTLLGTFSGGGYFIIYGLVFLVGYYYKEIFIIKSKNRILKFLLLVLIELFIIKANFATAFIMSFIIIIVTIFVYNFKKLSVFSFAFLILIGILLFNYTFITKEIIKQLPSNSIISIRLQDAIENDDDSTLHERIRFLEKSLNIVKSNFVFGIAAKNGFDYNRMHAEAGLHTEWIDFIVRYGFIIAVMYWIYLIKAFKTILKYYKDKNLYKVYFISLLILGFLNPLLNTSAFLIVFMVVPMYLLEGDEVEKSI